MRIFIRECYVLTAGTIVNKNKSPGTMTIKLFISGIFILLMLFANNAVAQQTNSKEDYSAYLPELRAFNRQLASMINYRVENLEALIGQLRKDGVTITDTIATVEYGKFVHIMDIEGNKLELWEPNDIEFDKLGKQINSKTIK